MEVRTIKQALQSDFSSISKLKKNYGEIQSRALVADLIADVVEFLNVGKTMNPVQIAETTKMVEIYFPHLNPADLKLCFNAMKLGRYGKFYDRIDGQVFLQAIEEYNQERMNVIESINNDNHKELKKNGFQTSSYHPKVIQALKDAIGEKKHLWGKEELGKIETKADIGQKWLRQFDNLFLKYGKVTGNVRFLILGNSRFSIETFVERKTNNYFKKESKS